VGLILHNVEIGATTADVRVEAGVVSDITSHLRAGPDDDVVDGEGGALIPGLHDHHVHVLSLARARSSVAVGPRDTPSRAAFVSALRAASTRGAVRATGYHERVYGPLDREVLDTLVQGVPVRVQHRSGGLWVLNTPALNAVDPERLADERFERDETGCVTGRLWRGDELLRSDGDPPSVEGIGADFTQAGVTAITDASETNDAAAVARLRELSVRVRVMGPIDLTFVDTPRLALGEVKIILDDETLPEIDAAVALVREAHALGRGVAVHCVTLVQLRFALETLRLAGVRGDRIEHASVAPTDAIEDLCNLNLTVVTQPAFVASRGAEYFDDVDARDLPALYPIASLIEAGVRTLGSSDAPYGPADPWEAMRAAVNRRTDSGHILGASQRVSASTALAMFGATSSIRVGMRADLALLAVPLATALRELTRENVVLTVLDGQVVHRT
jgi:predicted amidohydrolase YtcJ